MAHFDAARVVALGTTTDLQTWITSNIFPIALLVIAVLIMFGSKKKDHRGTIQIVGIVLIALTVAGLATGTTATDVGTSLAAGVKNILAG